MKRSTQDLLEAEKTAAETSSSPISRTSKKRKSVQSYEEKLIKKYKKEIARWDPTAPDEDVEEIVEKRIPFGIATIMKEFDICQDSLLMKFVPREKIKKIITNIVINCINTPIRNLIFTHLLHFQ